MKSKKKKTSKKAIKPIVRPRSYFTDEQWSRFAPWKEAIMKGEII